MNLRDLLSAARTAGWQHITYDGSFGREHVWLRDNLRVSIEPWPDRDGSQQHRLTIVDASRGQRLVQGRVDSVDQAVKLLAAYNLTTCGCHARMMRTLADLEAISQAGHEAAANTHRQTVALHATDGAPIALALTDKALTALGGAS